MGFMDNAPYLAWGITPIATILFIIFLALHLTGVFSLNGFTNRNIQPSKQGFRNRVAQPSKEGFVSSSFSYY
jgi:hypothetical protein